MADDKLIGSKPLADYCSRLFQAVGMSREDADLNADNLVDADLTGVESHGVSRMPIYLKRIRDGVVLPRSEVVLAHGYHATGVFDGGNGMGAPVSSRVMKTVIEKANQYGIAFFTVKNSNHFGTAAYFAKMALEHDMIGYASTNGPARMAPWGGSEPYFGTNPFAMAIPADQERPIVADMATSVVARGKIIIAAKKNQPIPTGWALTKDGQETTDPAAALVGTVLPFGGPKGSAIALIIDVLGGILSGSRFGPHLHDMYGDFENPTYTSHTFAAIKIDAFSSAAKFKTDIDQMIREIKTNRRAENVAEIFLPGEIELRKKEERLKTGIPLPQVVLDDLRREGELCRVPYNLEG